MSGIRKPTAKTSAPAQGAGRSVATESRTNASRAKSKSSLQSTPRNATQPYWTAEHVEAGIAGLSRRVNSINLPDLSSFEAFLKQIAEAHAERFVTRKHRAEFVRSLITEVPKLLKTGGPAKSRADGSKDVSSLRNRVAIGKAQLAGQSVKAQLLKDPEMLSGDFAAARISKSRQTINNQRQAGRIFGLTFGDQQYRYPAWQFDDAIYGNPLASVLEELKEADPWSTLQFFTAPDGMLNGLSPLDALRSHAVPLDRVVTAARAFARR